MISSFRRKLLLSAILATGLAACTSAPKAPLPAPEPAASDIVDTAIAAGSFNTLVAAVQAAQLVDTLKGEGPFTVFAPTDDAFAKLPAGTVDSLLLPENLDQLQAVLTYHVLPGAVMSGDISGQKLQPATVNGQTLNIDATSGVNVNNATVISADVGASNGVIPLLIPCCCQSS